MDTKPSLKELQALGKEMQENIGFEPPIKFNTDDENALIKDIEFNASDLDADKDKAAISAKGKATLAALGVGPWPAAKKEEKKKEDAPKATPPSQVEAAKPEKSAGKKETEMKKPQQKKDSKATAAKKRADKPATKKQEKKKDSKPKAAARSGVGEWVKAQLRKNKDIPNAELAAAARDKFPGARTSPACISWYRARL